MSCLGLRVRETKEVYEGEITELTPTEADNPLSGYGKTISHVVVALKTVKGTKQLRLDPSIYESIMKERVTIGDIIYIEANTGAVKVSLQEVYSASLLTYNLFYSEWDDQMHMLQNLTWRQKNTSHYQREKFTREKRSCKM